MIFTFKNFREIDSHDFTSFLVWIFWPTAMCKHQLFVYILETPCWIEVQLHRALQLADELLHSIPIEHHRRMNSHMND